jgi:uncharacterized protein YxjI
MTFSGAFLLSQAVIKIKAKNMIAIKMNIAGLFFKISTSDYNYLKIPKKLYHYNDNYSISKMQIIVQIIYKLIKTS